MRRLWKHDSMPICYGIEAKITDVNTCKMETCDVFVLIIHRFLIQTICIMINCGKESLTSANHKILGRAMEFFTLCRTVG